MIRVDRNHQESLNILSDTHLSWQPNDSDFIHHVDNKDQHQIRPATPTDPQRDRSSSLSPAPDTNSPQTQPEAPSSPPLPPTAEEKEEPVKVPRREEEEEEETRVDKSSRQSTPLSELSPPPDDIDASLDQTPTPILTSTSHDPKSVATALEEQRKKAVSDGVDVGVRAVERIGQGKGLSDSAPSSLLSSPSTDKKLSDSLAAVNAAASMGVTASQLLSGHVTSPIDGPGSHNNASTKASEAKVVTILELNSELIHICMEFQKKGIAPMDSHYQQFSHRLQSNLTWLAAAADHNRTVNHSIALPMMYAPLPVEFHPCERIQQLYSEMPVLFAKEVARRQQLGIPTTGASLGSSNPPLTSPLKRERPEDGLLESVSKRQNTGEAKNTSSMMPPPSIPNAASSSIAPPTTPSLPTGRRTQSPTSTHFSVPISNGANGPSPSAGLLQQPGFPRLSPDSSLTAAQPGMINPSLLNSPDPQLAASLRARQVQLRAHQQQAAANAKRMSPPSVGGAGGLNPAAVGQQQGMNVGGAGAGAGTGGGGHSSGPTPITMQQAVHILQNPTHPIMQYLMRAPGFQSLPQQAQLQKIAMTAFQMQSRQQAEQQQRAAAAAANMANAQQMQGVSLQNNAGGMSFPGGHASAAQFSGMGSVQQNNMFPAGIQGGSTNNMGGGMGGGMGGINLNNLTPQQKQLLLMQQQRGNANMGMGMGMGSGAGVGVGSPGGSGMMMNPQQMAFVQQQQAQQQAQQQQRMAGAMGVNMGSPMIGSNDGFPPTLRSNATIPGIARSTRSPSDTAPSPITPRSGSAFRRGGSLGPEDYQRMMMKQQQQQNQSPQGNMFGTPNVTAQNMMGGNWAGQGGGGMGMGMVGGGQGQGQGQGQHQQLQGMHMQTGYGMSSPSQQQQQQAQSAGTGLGPFMGTASSPPPMGVSNTSWPGSQSQPQASPSSASGASGMFNPFSPTGGGVTAADLTRSLSGTPGPQHQPSSSLVGPQDDYGGLFDWGS
ncbi:hypothetical protein AMATHDRAFT_61265 [Amanita thiersii Skay4041]|uniref:SS18 N-terminal domain-containing protein n=1 Tax=Amanita thiersii Skay4041 TaxID=703135 RepID=A0A2A9NRG1_9AGAR|nr:hypothetical protein AMATHDRAFT_61265 [Amanita thiersii Skay4041]